MFAWNMMVKMEVGSRYLCEKVEVRKGILQKLLQW